MPTNCQVILKDLRFSPINESEQRTSMHFSDFAGHEKRYLIQIDGSEIALIWRKGHYTTYAFLGNKDHVLESVEPVNYMRVIANTETYDLCPPTSEMCTFCDEINHLIIDEAAKINTPDNLTRLLVNKHTDWVPQSQILSFAS